MSELKSKIAAPIEAAESGRVWVPTDFAQLGSRDAIDKTLQRMVRGGALRRIDRGLYDRLSLNNLTKRPTTPDSRAVTEAIARRDHLRLLVDGMTAANDLGLTDAVPARVTIHTDTRRRAIQLDKLTIEFKQTAPSRLYWAGRPAMRVVQALYWLKDTLTSERSSILGKLTKVLVDPVHGPAIRQDLLDGAFWPFRVGPFPLAPFPCSFPSPLAFRKPLDIGQQGVTATTNAELAQVVWRRARCFKERPAFSSR